MTSGMTDRFARQGKIEAAPRWRVGLMSITRWRFGLVLGAMLIAGCASRPPGTIEQQRIRATINDPYSDPDAGPEVVGGRPRDYQQPLPVSVKNRIYVDSWWGQ
jgi:hypothetical protein